jgi:hypothetical protein
MAVASVAVAGCRRTPASAADDLWPDPDYASLQLAFQGLGATCRAVAWDDPGADWQSFSHVLVSSTWDVSSTAEGAARMPSYRAWLAQVSAVTCLVNPLAVVEWGLDKAHQKELARAGVPVVPTVWLEPGDPAPPVPGSEFVVKPSVAGGGRGAMRYRAGDEDSLSHIKSLQDQGSTVMLQPYVPSIEEHAEANMVFIGGRFSHAVRKAPLLRVGRVLERPWEHLSWQGLVVPTNEMLGIGQAVIGFLEGRFGAAPVYCRVDVVPAGDGPSVLMEVEVVDPFLSLDMAPGADVSLAKASLK